MCITAQTETPHCWHAAQLVMHLDDPRCAMIPAAAAMLPVNCCPRCNAPDGIQRLLTSMVRYYACSRCDCRWQVWRGHVAADGVEVEGADPAGVQP